MMLPENIRQHALLGFSIVFLVAIAFHTVFPGDDPYRCRALIQTGRWIDPPLANGSRMPFSHWQPDGCIMKSYSSDDIQSCVQKRKLVFGGDSTARRPMRETAVMLTSKEQVDHDVESWNPKNDVNATYFGIDLYKDTNTYLHTDFDKKEVRFMQHLREYRREKRRGFNLPVEKQKGPAVFYLSAGVWLARPQDYKGLDTHARVQLYGQGLTNISNVLGPNKGNTFYNQPLDPLDGVGNQMFYFPPHGPTWQVKERRPRIPQVKKMREWLRKHEDSLNMPVVWATPRMVEGQEDAWNGDGTGFHVNWDVNRARMNLVFNARCNAKMDRLRPHEEGTCCTDYGPKPFIQSLTVLLAIVWLILCVVFSVISLFKSSDDEQQQQQPRFPIFSTQTVAFPLVLLMSYFADRTQMMAKGERIYHPSTFAAFIFIILIVVLVTIRKNPTEEGEYQTIGGEQQQQQPEDEPHDFLPKPMTEEWKGWMILVLLSYHWCNASTAQPLLITSRVLLSAYLLLLGYTHTISYLTTADFSLHRLATKILRLNLLSWGLAFTMNTNSMTYYIGPLLTFWSLIIYAITATAQRFNSDPVALLTKILLSAGFVSFILSFSPLISWSHFLAKLVFQIQVSEETWTYRLTSDTTIVYIGMVLAVFAKHHSPSTILSTTTIFLAATCIAATIFYLAAPLIFGIDTYSTLLHDLTCFLPILAYITLRNVTPTLRKYHATAMAWVGNCSLETYILQIHLFTASTSQGVLLIDGLSGGDATFTGRLGSLLIITPIFLWASSEAAKATTVLVKALLDEGKSYGDSHMAVQVAMMPAVKVGALFAVMWTANLASPEGMKAPVY